MVGHGVKEISWRKTLLALAFLPYSPLGNSEKVSEAMRAKLRSIAECSGEVKARLEILRPPLMPDCFHGTILLV